MGLRGTVVSHFHEASQRQVLFSIPSTYFTCLPDCRIGYRKCKGSPNVLGSCEPADTFRVKLWGGRPAFQHHSLLHFRLMLMSLYNVSINLKGLKYISESPGFIPLLWWLLSGKEGSACRSLLQLVYLLLCGWREW